MVVDVPSHGESKPKHKEELEGIVEGEPKLLDVFPTEHLQERTSRQH